MTISFKDIPLGYFQSKIDAARARWKAEVEHDFPNCNTTSTAYLYLQKNNYKKEGESRMPPNTPDPRGKDFITLKGFRLILSISHHEQHP